MTKNLSQIKKSEHVIDKLRVAPGVAGVMKNKLRAWRGVYFS